MELYEVTQSFPDERIIDIPQQVQNEVKKHLGDKNISKGSEIAITAGSRGISNIVEILYYVVKAVTDMGYKPFIVPAMGSHGGATAEGQIEVLKHLGITEKSVGAEIRSSMEVELIGHTPDGTRVYMDKNAYHADGIIVVNRIKTHTAFQGKIESGISKMVTIGLGKIKGATFVHSDGALKMAENIENVSKFAIHNSPILFGLAILENGYDETSDIVGVEVEGWHEKEASLLKKSKSMMPSLPIPNIDLLIVEEMGKSFSGTGMDPTIIGRWRIKGVPEPTRPEVEKLVVLDLAENSHGNAQGIGLADFTTEKLVDKIDRNATYTNALTSTYLQRAMLPLIYETEKLAIETAISSLGPDVQLEDIKMVQIPNTLHLGKVLVSKKVLEKMEAQKQKYQIGRKVNVTFSDHGDLEYKITYQRE